MRAFALSTVAALALATPALAGQCPMMMTQVEDALAAATLDDAGKAQVETLLAEGRAAHDAGDHAASEAKLTEAMALLGLA